MNPPVRIRHALTPPLAMPAGAGFVLDFDIASGYDPDDVPLWRFVLSPRYAVPRNALTKQGSGIVTVTGQTVALAFAESVVDDVDTDLSVGDIVNTRECAFALIALADADTPIWTVSGWVDFVPAIYLSEYQDSLVSAPIELTLTTGQVISLTVSGGVVINEGGVNVQLTLGGTPDYITLADNVLTRNQIDLTTDVTGVLPIANIATGTPDGSKFVRDDGTLQSIVSNATHTGDVTGATELTIANNAVTFAKIQTISGETLIGRHGGGTGNPQSVSVGNGIEFQGSGIRRAALTGDVTATAGSNATTIANGVVTEAKCNSSINTSLDLADSAIQPGNAALTDARTPTAHKASHATGGSDALTPGDIGAATSAQGSLAASAVQPGASFTAGAINASGGIDAVFGALTMGPYGTQPFFNVGVNAYYAFCSTSTNAFVGPDSALHPATGGVLLMTPNKSAYQNLSLKSLIATESVRPGSYTVATVPAAASHTGGMIFVTDETGGAVPAFSDGTNWRRVTDRAIIS